MEVCGWQHGQRESKGTLALLPPSWDSLAQIYREVASLVSKIPYKRRLILYLTFRGTSIKIDLGDVKAAGVVCILGIGFGLGSVLIYKLYCNFIRPVLNSQNDRDPEKSDNDDEFYAYVSPSDSAPNNKMGNTGCKTSAAVFYSKEYGVAFGKNYSEANPEEEQPVQIRHRKPPLQRRSSLQSDKDSAIGVPSEMGLSAHSNVNRDSFYSTCTAESGFVNGADTYDDNSSCDSFSHLRKGSRSLSLQENYSPSSLLDKRRRYFRGSKGGVDESDNESQSTISIHSADNVGLNQCSVFLTPASDSASSPKSTPQRTFFSPKSSPFHQSIGGATVITRVGFSSGHSEGSSCLSVGQSEWDRSLEISESLRSLSGGGSSVGDWSAEDEEGRDSMSPLPSLTQSTSDFQFRESVLQRMKEWASQTNETYLSRSPTPERIAAEQTRAMRRSRSLDRQYPEEDLAAEEVMLQAEPLVDLGETTTKNLEVIENGLQGIQDEFEDIATAITRLCAKGHSDSPGRTSATASPPTRPESQHVRELVRRTRTRWERSPSLPGSERSSRASSVELTWDHGYLQDEDAQHVIKSRLGHTRQLSLPDQRGDLEEDGSSSPSPSASRTKQLKGKHKQKTRSLTNSPAGTSWKGPNGEDVSERKADEKSCFTPAVPGGGPPLIQNISEAEDIVEYAEKEWKGGTPKAEAIKQGYRKIPEVFQCKQFRSIRGDNYCALRSCLYQALTLDVELTRRLPSFIDSVNAVTHIYRDSSLGLQQWNFGNRIPDQTEDKLQTMCQCLMALHTLVDEVSKLQTYAEREKVVLERMNAKLDEELMEGMKLLMLVTAHKLLADTQAKKEIPLFAMLMFARDTSEDISSLIQNHLNPVGNSAGLDQIDMCLLGHTLKARIKVARLSQSGAEDFISVFPEDTPEDWPSICVLAEDDRHYNVPIP